MTGQAEGRCSHHNTTEVSVGLRQCSNCHLILKVETGDLAPKDLYEDYYKNEITGNRFGSGVELVVRLFRLFRAFKVYLIKPAGLSILDIGSGRGFMLYYLRRYFGYTAVFGTQISAPALNFSRRRLDLNIYGEDLLQLKLADNSFDLITMWHVLEHVDDPEGYIQEIWRLLKSGGTLVVEVPNFNSWTRRLTGKYWLSLDPKYHQTFFTPNSLSALLKKYGFKIKKIHTFSLEYSIFTSVQSVVSLVTKTDQLFFKWLQSAVFNPAVLLHILLFALFFLPCGLINLGLYFSNYGEVLTIIAEKTSS